MNEICDLCGASEFFLVIPSAIFELNVDEFGDHELIFSHQSLAGNNNESYIKICKSCGHREYPDSSEEMGIEEVELEDLS